MLLLGTGFMCVSLTPHIEELLEENVNLLVFPNKYDTVVIKNIFSISRTVQIPHFGATCELLKIGGKCELFVGYMAVYRTAFALSGFFFLMSLLTIGLKKSRGFRAGFHNGAWMWKFLMLIGIGVGVFCLPSERITHFQIGNICPHVMSGCIRSSLWTLSQNNKLWILALFPVWMYRALVGTVAFVLVFFARSLGNKINHRVAEGGSPVCWYGGKNIPANCYIHSIHHFMRY